MWWPADVILMAFAVASAAGLLVLLLVELTR